MGACVSQCALLPCASVALIPQTQTGNPTKQISSESASLIMPCAVPLLWLACTVRLRTTTGMPTTACANSTPPRYRYTRTHAHKSRTPHTTHTDTKCFHTTATCTQTVNTHSHTMRATHIDPQCDTHALALFPHSQHECDPGPHPRTIPCCTGTCLRPSIACTNWHSWSCFHWHSLLYSPKGLHSHWHVHDERHRCAHIAFSNRKHTHFTHKNNENKFGRRQSSAALINTLLLLDQIAG